MSKEELERLATLLDRIERAASLTERAFKLFLAIIGLTASGVLWGSRLEWKIGNLENTTTSQGRKLDYQETQTVNLHESIEVLKAKLNIAKTASKDHSNTN